MPQAGWEEGWGPGPGGAGRVRAGPDEGGWAPPLVPGVLEAEGRVPTPLVVVCGESLVDHISGREGAAQPY